MIKISQKITETKRSEIRYIHYSVNKTFLKMRKLVSGDSVMTQKRESEIEHHTPSINDKENDIVPSFLATEVVANMPYNELLPP